MRESNTKYGITQSLLREHMLITGPTRSRKTSLVISPLVHQLMERIGKSRREPKGRTKAPGTVICVDLKGDTAWFHGVKSDAEKMNVPFKWLTIETGRASYGWNMFTQKINKRMRFSELTQQSMRGLGLDYGDDYGRGFFMGANWRLFGRCLHEHDILSFEHLVNILDHSSLFTQKELDKAEAFVNVIRRMAFQPVLNMQNQSDSFSDNGDADRSKGQYGQEVVDQCIEFTSIFSEPQVVYLWLPVTEQPMDSRMVAKLFMNQLLAAANVRTREEQLPIYMFVDEFQEIVDSSGDLGLFFAQARSKRIGVIAAHQSMAQLRTPTRDLRAVAREGVGCRVQLGGLDKENMAEVLHDAKDNVEGLYVLEYLAELAAVGVPDVAYGSVPAVDERSLRAMATNPHAGLITVRDPDANPKHSDPLGRPEYIYLRHHIEFGEYKKRNEADWPELSDAAGTIEAPADYGTTKKKPRTSRNRAKPKSKVKNPTVKPVSISTKEGKAVVAELMERATSWLQKRSNE